MGALLCQTHGAHGMAPLGLSLLFPMHLHALSDGVGCGLSVFWTSGLVTAIGGAYATSIFGGGALKIGAISGGDSASVGLETSGSVCCAISGAESTDGSGEAIGAVCGAATVETSVTDSPWGKAEPCQFNSRCRNIRNCVVIPHAEVPLFSLRPCAHSSRAAEAAHCRKASMKRWCGTRYSLRRLEEGLCRSTVEHGWDIATVNADLSLGAQICMLSLCKGRSPRQGPTSPILKGSNFHTIAHIDLARHAGPAPSPRSLYSETEGPGQTLNRARAKRSGLARWR